MHIPPGSTLDKCKGVEAQDTSLDFQVMKPGLLILELSITKHIVFGNFHKMARIPLENSNNLSLMEPSLQTKVPFPMEPFNPILDSSSNVRQSSSKHRKFHYVPQKNSTLTQSLPKTLTKITCETSLVFGGITTPIRSVPINHNLASSLIIASNSVNSSGSPMKRDGLYDLRPKTQKSDSWLDGLGGLVLDLYSQYPPLLVGSVLHLGELKKKLLEK